MKCNEMVERPVVNGYQSESAAWSRLSNLIFVKLTTCSGGAILRQVTQAAFTSEATTPAKSEEVTETKVKQQQLNLKESLCSNWII